MPHLRPILLVLLTICVGCDEREAKLHDWQQQQVDQLQQQAHENSAASRALVAADAESRRQFVALEASLEGERQEMAAQYTALDADRKAVAAARERVPLLATALEGMAAVTLGILALVICVRLLGRLSADEGSAELEEALILSVAGESDLLADTRVLLPKPLDRPAIEQGSPEPDQ